MADKLVKLGSLVGPTGSQYIQTNSSDTGIKNAASNIIKAYNIRVGDYTISTDTNTIWQCISDTAFSQGPSIKGGTGSTGSTGLQGNGFYVMSEESIEDLIQCLDSNYISVNRDTLVDVLLSEANGGENSQLSQEMSLGLYHHFGGNDYNYYLIDGYLLGNVICEHDGEPVSYVSSYEFVKISSGGSEYTAGTNIDISNSTISAEGYVWNEEKNSFAEGNSSTASGSYSHAEGNSSTASGSYSHAEGYITTASGVISHAEGFNTKASGSYSHAEGHTTTASGSNSHTEGYSSMTGGNATKNNLTAGASTTSGSYAHAEGNATIAKGVGAHAEGKKTFASGNYSHAEGESTTVGGSWSHAEGYKTTVTANVSHVEGETNIVSGAYSHAEGKSNTLISAPCSHIEGANNALFLSNSHAEGSENISHGYISHIEGNMNTVTGYAAHTEGMGNIASGDAAHAEGGIAYKENNYKYDFELSSATYNSSTGILECTTTTEIPDYIISSCIAANFHYGTGSWDHKCYWIKQVEKTASKNYKLQLHEDTLSCITNGIKPDPSTIATIIKLSLIRRGNIASGNSSHAEGSNTTAEGNYSHAEGYGSIASGIGSHAEGAKYDNNRNTESAGQASHAEGASTYAKADGSHAEGILNIAGRFLDEISTAAQELGISGTPEELAAKLLGYGAHAEGMNNKALGSCSHSEGNATQALANSTHAEGDTTIAFGEASHAEGYNTQAKGNQSHTEGSNTIAIGNSSHAEGVSTVASGSFSHAEGSHTEATGRDSHSEGAYSKAIGIASHAEGEYSHAEADYSHTEGSNTVAQGMASHAEGVSTKAKGYASHSEGEGTVANGYSSHAEGGGYSSSVTHEIVIKEFVNDDYLDNVCNYTGIGFNYFTEHNNILLNGAEIYDSRDTDLEQCIGKILESKYVEGYGDTMPSGTYLKIDFYTSNAFGSLTNLDGGKSALILRRSGSYNDYSHSEGDCTIAEGFASHSEGCGTVANGEASHAEGNSTIAHGEYSHAEGYFNIADGYYSHSEGYYNTSSGDASHTEGSSNIAQGYCSHAEGVNTKAKGDYSHAEGSGTTTEGDYSHAEGLYTQTTNNIGEHAEGRYNKSNVETISSIGIGSSTSNRKNAVEVMVNGDMYIKGIGGYDGTNPYTANTIQRMINDFANNTAGYITEIPIASSTRLGGIKVGSNLNIGGTGVLTAKGYTWDNGSSTMTVNGQINASLGFYETSDIRKKNVIDELPLDKAYELINNCQSIIYTLKDSTDKQQIGLIAQEVQQYFPEVVSEDKDGYLSLDYAKLTAVIFRVLKDIIDRLSKLENK